MANSKIILTADDFGVDDSINKGVITLAKAGILDSVEVLPNYGENGKLSIQNTLKLLDETAASHPGLELGVHLTITSGKPIEETLGLSAILCKGHFISAKKTNSGASKQAIFDELVRQVEVLKSNARIWSKVTHLTNHHDALWFFPEYSEMYVKVAEKYNLPIRNPRVLPAWNAELYYKYLGPREAIPQDKEKSRKAYNLREKGQFEGVELNFRSTNYLDSSHYSLWRTILDSNPYKPEKFIERRREALREVFKRVKSIHEQQQTPQVVEVLFHVRDGALKSKVKLKKSWREEKGIDAFDEYDLANYNGISTTYFDGRAIEFASLAWEHRDPVVWKALYNTNNVERGKWKDCIARKLYKV